MSSPIEMRSFGFIAYFRLFPDERNNAFLRLLTTSVHLE
jgi:hypothetical protein